MTSMRAGSAGEDEPQVDRAATSRLTAAEIYSTAVRIGEDELKRSSTGLALSGLAAGLGMGLTDLGAARSSQSWAAEWVTTCWLPRWGTPLAE
jgi:hypothetical protein